MVSDREQSQNDADQARSADPPMDVNSRESRLWSETMRLKSEVEVLRMRNAALVEIVRDSLCPYNGRHTGVTVGECQQCGCTHGMMIKPYPAPPLPPRSSMGGAHG